LKQKRAGIDAEQKKEWDRAIVAAIEASELFLRASAVLLYAPIGSEIDLLPLVRTARKMGKPVAFPRCDTQTNEMRFFILEPNARLTEGADHIPEPPADAPPCSPDENALCLLPALSFDPTGARIGYGKGYYDRFLKDFRGVSVGAAYRCMLSDRLPTEPHDRPVCGVFTENGFLACRQEKKELERETQTPALFAGATQEAARPAREPQGAQRKSVAPHAPPLLVAVTFALLLLSRLIDPYLTTRSNAFAVVVLLQLLIFLIPAVLYAKLRGEKFTARMRLGVLRPEHLWFTLCMAVVMVTGGLLCSILTGGISSLTGSFTLYDTFVASFENGAADILYVILAYSLIPAFCEELVYRSFLCAEYERFGAGVAIVASALFFAMLHFSFQHFLGYLVLGLLLACAMYVTRSFFTAVLLHLAYNLFCLFGRPYLSTFYVYAGSNEIFLFCLITLFLLFSAFAVGEARKIYHVYAVANKDSSYAPPHRLRELPKALLRALASPVSAVCVLIWLIAALLQF